MKDEVTCQLFSSCSTWLRGARLNGSMPSFSGLPHSCSRSRSSNGVLLGLVGSNGCPDIFDRKSDFSSSVLLELIFSNRIMKASLELVRSGFTLKSRSLGHTTLFKSSCSAWLKDTDGNFTIEERWLPSFFSVLPSNAFFREILSSSFTSLPIFHMTATKELLQWLS